MIAELGHFALVLALGVTILQGTVPILGAWQQNNRWCAFALTASYVQGALVLFAFIALSCAFLDYDFSVRYVAQNSNLSLPWYYRLSAVWGAHEGSLLLWALILSGWTVAVALFSQSLPLIVRARVLGVLALVSVGFLLFMLATSNPFDRLINPPLDGRDLNPLLQDPGLIIHPPLLYMGYVGLAVPFAFAIAALLGGRVDAAWTRWTRPWTTIAWVFLTLGITLGSWWAYYELGWGGWWFWDPVENASFMPWLAATALIHSLAVTEQRSAFKAWTVLLAIIGFSLSLLGTFLVRSGVLVSVHAFASDPERGQFILVFLFIVVGAALVLFALRGPALRDSGHFELYSRETLLLFNNVILAVAAASVLIGTLYPIGLDWLGLDKISVGAPYFNLVFVGLMFFLLPFVGIAPQMRWKRDSWSRSKAKLALWFALSLALAAVWLLVAIPLPETTGAVMIAGVALASWIIVSACLYIFERIKRPANSASGKRFRRPSLALLGMTLAHLGVGCFVAGVTVTSYTSTEVDVALKAGEMHRIGDYEFRFEGVRQVQGVNYLATEGTVVVSRNGIEIARLGPQKRRYSQPSEPMTEASIDAELSRDLYVALGDSLGANAWSLRLYVKPYIRWIWLGALIMAFGGILAACDKRYRPVRVEAPAPLGLAPAQASA